MGLLKEITLLINKFFAFYIFIYSSITFLSIVIGAINLHNWEKRRKKSEDALMLINTNNACLYSY